MFQDAPVFLKVEHLGKQVPNVNNPITILNDINLIIKRGESIAIQGKSGSGKTTLLTILAGLDSPSCGNVYFKEYHLNVLDEEQRAQLRAQYMSFIFQSFQLVDTLTALENVMLPLEIKYVPHKRAKSEAIAWLQEVGLEERLLHYPSKLSGGEQQRVAIARAFVTQPQIIFADEMTGNLDIQTGGQIIDILFKLNEIQKTTLVLVTHDSSLAMRCHRCLILSEGQLQAC